MPILDAVVLPKTQEQSSKAFVVLLQMQKHADKLQQEKEEQCMSNIKSEMPNVSPAVLALALHEVDWDVRAAVQLVSLFMDARGREWDELQQVLHRPACPLNSAVLRSQAEIFPHGLQSHAASRKDTTPAGAEQASGSDDSSPSRAKQKKKSKTKKDKSKKDKKHKKRRLPRTEKVSLSQQHSGQASVHGARTYSAIQIPVTCMMEVLMKHAVSEARCLVLTCLSPAYFDYTSFRTHMHEANNLASMASSEKQMLTGEHKKLASDLVGLWQSCVAMLRTLSQQ